MEQQQRRVYDPADDLWTTIVSFVLYVALLLVLNRALLEPGSGRHAMAGWRLQDVAALVLGVWGLTNLLGYGLWRRRPLWLILGIAQGLAGYSFYRMGDVDWLWLCLTALAIVLWAYAFQVSISAAVTGAREDSPSLWAGQRKAEEESFCGIVPPEEEDAEPEDEGTWRTPPHEHEEEET